MAELEAGLRPFARGEVPERSNGAVSKCAWRRAGPSYRVPEQKVFCGSRGVWEPRDPAPSQPVLSRPVPIWVPMLSSVRCRAKTVTWSFLMHPWAPDRPSVPGHRSIVAENLKIW
jgi:hypothetical protein